jgi:hypothetical protein
MQAGNCQQTGNVWILLTQLSRNLSQRVGRKVIDFNRQNQDSGRTTLLLQIANQFLNNGLSVLVYISQPTVSVKMSNGRSLEG